jgi:hypothetical protein
MFGSVQLVQLLCLLAACLFLYIPLIEGKSASETYTAPSQEEFSEQLNLIDPTDNDPLPTEIASDQELFEQLAPILASRSVERVGAFLKNDAIGLDQRVSLLSSIVSNLTYGFSHDDAMQLVLDVANMYEPNSAEQERIFDVLLQHRSLFKKTSPLFIAVKHDYTKTYLPLLAWSYKNIEQYPDIKTDLATLKLRALHLAVDMGDAEVLQKINIFTQGVSPDEATELVWYIVTSGNHPELLPVIITLKPDINQVNGKKTPLIEAVDRSHRAVVEQLIALGVEIDKIADPEYGSALQRAIEARDLEIETILRKAGARE